jgi:membrane protease YdiL (CAAX protease family)
LEPARPEVAPALSRLDRRADRDVGIVLVTVAVSLTLAHYLARRDGTGFIHSETQLGGLTTWALVTIGAYVVPPWLVARYVLRRPITDLGLRVRGIGEHFPVYGALFAVAIPAVVLASFTHSFQAKYPFYELAPGEALWPNLWTWWLLYWAQFVALEFFFRGFIVHALAPRLGYVSVFVMIVPYNMIHYGKPMPEALAAIVGGLVLGTLSYRSRSIWWGAALHISIAITMDVCALWHHGRLF